jgi:hypothetical protein
LNIKKQNFKTWHIVLTVLLPLQIFAIQLLKQYPEWVENHYTLGLYQIYAKIFQSVFSLVPFSIGDLFYILVVLILLNKLRLIFLKRLKLRWTLLLQVTAWASVIYFWFHLSWGFNYYRLPLHQQLEINNNYSSDELARFTSKLVDKANGIHVLITNNDTLPVLYSESESEYKRMVFNNIDSISFLGQNVKHQSTKASLLSLPLSYMGFGGYLNPFTLEAQYNDKVPKYKYPSLIAHEMAHQMGYAKENEANFVSCYTNMHSKNLKLKYAGYTYALKFCLNELYFTSPEDFELLREKVNPGILKNFKEINTFWESYINPFEPLFKKFYGNFLKVNNQPKGIKSYNYVVALLVNYYDEKSLP